MPAEGVSGGCAVEVRVDRGGRERKELPAFVDGAGEGEKKG